MARRTQRESRPPSDPADAKAEAVRRAARLLAVRDRSEADLRTRLARAGFDTAASDHAIATMRRMGALNDARHAESVVRRVSRSIPAGDALVSRALARARAASSVRSAAIKALPPERTRARDAARRIAAKVPEDLDPRARWQRVAAALARRGFAFDLAIDALRDALGPEPTEPDADRADPTQHDADNHPDSDTHTTSRSTPKRTKKPTARPRGGGLQRRTPLSQTSRKAKTRRRTI
jgi:regulatory protein